MTARCWFVIAEDTPTGQLLAAAHGLGGDRAGVVVGPEELAAKAARSFDRLEWIPSAPSVPDEGWASAVADHLAHAGAELVLAADTPMSRILLGAVAARLRAPVFAPVRKVRRTAPGIEVVRPVYGGIALERDTVSGPACLVLEGDPGVSPESTQTHRRPEELRRVQAQPLPVRCTGAQTMLPVHRDLATAPRVIGVGRGLRDRDYLEEVERLADALGAEIACTRPVAEDLGWLPRDRYLGVSGRRIAPKLYLMLGVSGELQHMIGVQGAELIVAVNTDPRAPAVTESDIAIIGDLRMIVPSMLRQLGSAERRPEHA